MAHSNAISLHTFTPIFRLLMKTGNRDYEYVRCRWIVDDAVGEADHPATPDGSTERMPGQRKFLDYLYWCPSVLAKLRSEIGTPQVVITDRNT